VQDWGGAGLGPDPSDTKYDNIGCDDEVPEESCSSSLQITQLSASSITVSWSLASPQARSPKRASLNSGQPAGSTMSRLLSHLSMHDNASIPNMSLYITAASNMGLESPVLVLSNVVSTGTFRIEGLDSGT